MFSWASQASAKFVATVNFSTSVTAKDSVPWLHRKTRQHGRHFQQNGLQLWFKCIRVWPNEEWRLHLLLLLRVLYRGSWCYSWIGCTSAVSDTNHLAQTPSWNIKFPQKFLWWWFQDSTEKFRSELLHSDLKSDEPPYIWRPNTQNRASLRSKEDLSLPRVVCMSQKNYCMRGFSNRSMLCGCFVLCIEDFNWL